MTAGDNDSLSDGTSIDSVDLERGPAAKPLPPVRTIAKPVKLQKEKAPRKSRPSATSPKPSQEPTSNPGLFGVTSDFIARGPKTSFGICLGMHLFAVFVTGILIGTDPRAVFPVDNGPDWSYSVRDDTTLDKQLSYELIQDDHANDMWAQVLPQQSERSFRFKGEEIEIIYQGGCFTPMNLASIKSFEDELYSSAAYQSICALNTTSGTCKTPHSVVRFFDASYLSYFNATTLTRANDPSRPLFDGDPNYEAITDIIDTSFRADGQSTESRILASGNPDIKKILDFNLGRSGTDYNPNDPTTSRICRSRFEVGYPLAGFDNIKSDVQEQQKRMRAAQIHGLQDFLERKENVGSLKMFYNSKGLSQRFYQDSLVLSWRLCIGSAMVGLIGLTCLTHSPFVAVFTMIGMIGTFFWTNLIYRYIFDIEYFGLPHHTAAFVCFFIGAVHMLTLYGAWVRSNANDNMSQRIHDALSEVHKAMAATSMATSVCFWAFCFSPVLLPMPGALFMGLLCVVNYLTFITYVPSMLAARSLILNWHYGGRDVHHKDFALWRWKRITGHSWFRWFVLTMTTVLVVALLIIALSGFKREKSQVHLYARTNNFGQFETFKENEFGGATGDTNTQVKLVFGVRGDPNKEMCRPGSFTCRYDPSYIAAFDMSSATAQTEIEDLCTEIEELSVSDVNELAVRRQATGAALPTGYRPVEVKCWIKHQAEYLNSSGAGVLLELPYNFTDMQATMQTNTAAYPASVYRSCSYFPPVANSANEPACSRLNYCDTYYRHQEFGLLDWITNNGATKPTDDRMYDYIDSLGGTADATLTKENGSLTYAGNYGSFLRFAVIEVNLTINKNNQEFDEGIKFMEAWDRWLQGKVSTMTPFLSSAFQTTGADRTWSWMKVQKYLEPTLVQGFILASCFFAITVLVASNNFLVCMIATLGYAATLICVIGIYAIAKWDYGSTEIVNLAMVTGVVAETLTPVVVLYACSDEVDRHDKTRDSLVKSFLGVNGGVLISFLGTVFLLASPLWFFLSFSATFMMTIGLSLIIAEFLVMVLFGILGPEGESGQIVGRTTRMCGGVASIAPELFASTQNSDLDVHNYNNFKNPLSHPSKSPHMAVNPTLPPSMGARPSQPL